MHPPPDFKRRPIVGDERIALIPRSTIPKQNGGRFGNVMRSFMRLRNAAIKPSRAVPGRHGRWQSVVIRISSGKQSQLWNSFGRYMDRAGANPTECSFDEQANRVSAELILNDWQRHAAPHEGFIKLVISPEDASGMDLQKLASNLMYLIEQDHQCKYSWIGAIHTDTEHPHLHLAIRGVDSLGKRTWFEKEYIFNRMIPHARQLATDQIGYAPVKNGSEQSKWRSLSESQVRSR